MRLLSMISVTAELPHRPKTSEGSHRDLHHPIPASNFPALR